MTHYGEGEPRSAKNLPPSNPQKDFGPSLTRQSEAKQTDINVIMAKYQKTGVLPPMNRAAFFADVSKVTSFDDAVAVVHGIEDTFMELAPEIRKRFDNDPAKFIDFTNKAENKDEMVEMGLLKKDHVRPSDEEIEAALGRLIAAHIPPAEPERVPDSE